MYNYKISEIKYILDNQTKKILKTSIQTNRYACLEQHKISKIGASWSLKELDGT